jgi:nitroreductase
MNARLAPLFVRRSVRRYDGAPVTELEIRDLLEAAMAAPSAVAKDPWDFIVVRGREALGRLADVLPNGQMLREADAAIVVCGDPARAHRNQESYLLQDCSAAIENLLVAAALLGLGACWLGVHPNADRMEPIRQQFGIPASVLPVAAIALGRPAEFPAPRTRYRAEAVHFGAWGARG